jgi:hypothetical protein
MSVDENLLRLEAKVDKLTEAVMRLVLIEERQSTQGERLSNVEVRLASHDTAIQKTERKVDQWVNRGIGAWAVACLIWALLQFGARWLK